MERGERERPYGTRSKGRGSGHSHRGTRKCVILIRGDVRIERTSKSKQESRKSRRGATIAPTEATGQRVKVAHERRRVGSGCMTWSLRAVVEERADVVSIRREVRRCLCVCGN